MEYKPQPQHRDGIQNELDEAQVKSEGGTHVSNEEMVPTLSAEEKAQGVREEAMSPELAEKLALLREKGYLDTSFEGKEVHKLTVRALSKEEAFAEYKASGGDTLILDDFEEDNIFYKTPEVKKMDVMIMIFPDSSYAPTLRLMEALKIMNECKVRPVTYEELVQYGTAYPSHQVQSVLIALGERGTPIRTDAMPYLGESDGVRVFSRIISNGWGREQRFPVVLK